jgi:hypothetical protein
LFAPIIALLLRKNATGASTPTQPPPLSPSDIALASIAVNQEYLQNEFYLRVLTGQGLSAGDTSGFGQLGPVIVPAVTPLRFQNLTIRAIAEQLAKDEFAHLQLLRSTFASLGLTPPARPTLDLMNSFATLASAAGLRRRFDPFKSETDFLLLAFFLEQVEGATLSGGISLLQSSALRALGISLLGDETSHSGFIRLSLTQEKLSQEANELSALSQRLADSTDTIFNPLFNGRFFLSPVGDTGTLTPCTPRQFMNNIFLGTNANAGGFYPNSLNLPA